MLYPAMKKPQVFFNLFINNGSLLIISIGMTVVVIMGGIDLSVAAMIALSSVASAALLQNNVNPIQVMALMLLMGIGLGFVMGCIIHYLKVGAFVVTLMGQFFARGMAYVINESSITIKNEFYKFLALTKIHLPLFEKAYVYIPTMASVILLIITYILLSSTRFGRTVYAIGNNEQSAMLMGLPVARTKLIVVLLQRILLLPGRYCVQHLAAFRLWRIRAVYGNGRDLLSCDRRYCVDWRYGYCVGDALWRAHQRHHCIHIAAQRHAYFLVDTYWGRCVDADLHRHSKPVLSEEKGVVMAINQTRAL